MTFSHTSDSAVWLLGCVQGVLKMLCLWITFCIVTLSGMCHGCSFQCQSACLIETMLCDGMNDCEDGSDESSATCARQVLGDSRSEGAETELQRWRREVVQNITGYEVHLRRQRRQAVCTEDEWLCKVGDRCIKAAEVCDGQVDCIDKSDESFKVCSRKEFTCPPFSYRCSYGACVDGDAMCNDVLDCADQSDELQPECPNVISKPEHNLCREGEFACLDGEQCVNQSRRCDGYVDCDDGTDETVTECSRIRCEDFAFRCAYGACVDGDAACDGPTQCRDGSDELAPQCTFERPEPTTYHIVATTQAPSAPTFPTKDRTTREPPRVPDKPTERPITKPPIIGKPCSLPAMPGNGTYYSYACEPGATNEECLYREGTKVPPGYSLRFSCNPGFGLRGEETIACKSGDWFPKIPFCSDQCEPILASKLITLCRTDRFESLNCSQPMPSGSKVSFSCKPGYDAQTDPGYRTIQCRNGEWDRPLVESYCQPVCGKAVSGFAQPAVSHGTPTKYGEWPWHTGIYEYNTTAKRFEQICGGTMISPKVVVTAAHCLTIENDRNIIQKPKGSLRVAVGKYQRDYYSKADSSAQKRKVKSIEISPEYQAIYSLFSNDIAFIVVDKDFQISPVVGPICIDIGKNSFEQDQLVEGAIGQVVGWGLTSNQRPSEKLVLANMPFVPRDKCKKTISSKLVNYISSDKLCAGDKKSRVNVCPGDSGGGLMFYSQQTNAYYLRGIVSLGTDGCKGQEYALFTRVSAHRDSVQNYLDL